ncbi:MAG: hydroxymethylglutaryl-CoA lyase [Acidimicrobiales bacterium]
MIEICDVAARDGLQSDEVVWPVTDKLELIAHAVRAGLRRLEVASFVNPARVPAMAGAEELCAALPRGDGVRYVGLVLNDRGLDRAIAAGLAEINVVVVCSDTFGDRNQGTTAQGSVDAFRRIAARAADAGIITQVVLSTAFGCPYEGEVPVARVTDLAAQCAAAGPDRLTLADTIGCAAPADIEARVPAVQRELPDGVTLALHVHNSRGTGLANAWAAYGLGVRSFDASLGGIGGCPFAPGATGNVCLEDMAYLFERSGVSTGLDVDELIRASRWLSDRLGRPTPSNVAKAGPFPRRDLEPARHIRWPNLSSSRHRSRARSSASTSSRATGWSPASSS